MNDKTSMYTAFIAKTLDSRDFFECVAEESSEVTQAALKFVRASGMGNNRTPVTSDEAYDAFVEECIDLFIALSAVISIDDVIKKMNDSPKWERWAKRLGYVDIEFDPSAPPETVEVEVVENVEETEGSKE